MLVLSEIDADRISTARPPAAAVFHFPRGRMVGRGRTDGPRHPCGKLVQTPVSLPDLLEKRKLLVGEHAATDPRASHPLGILNLRGAITGIDYAAAMRFAGLYAAVWGRGTVRSHLETVIYGLRGHDYDDVSDIEREKRRLQLAGELGAATAVLVALGSSRPYHVLCNIAVYERPMRFMDLSRARSPAAWQADERDKSALREATDALAQHWKMGREHCAAAD